MKWPQKDTSIYEMTYDEYHSINAPIVRHFALFIGIPCMTVTLLGQQGLGLFDLGVWTNFFGWGGLMGPIGIILQFIKFMTDRDIKSGSTILVLVKKEKPE